MLEIGLEDQFYTLSPSLLEYQQYFFKKRYLENRGFSVYGRGEIGAFRTKKDPVLAGSKDAQAAGKSSDQNAEVQVNPRVRWMEKAIRIILLSERPSMPRGNRQ